MSVGAIEIPAATGFSNETVLFDAGGASRRRAHTRRLVVRIAPQTYTVFLEANFEEQFRVMRALGEHSDVPVPEMLWYEADPAWFDSPFWIMERIDGQVPSDAPPYAMEGWLHDAAPSSRRSCGGTGSRPWPRCTASTGARSGSTSSMTPTAAPRGVEQQLRYYEEALAWAEAAEDGRPHPGARAAVAWLTDHQPDSPPEDATIVWGDARLGNQMSPRRRDRRRARLGDGGAGRPTDRPRLVDLLRRRALHRDGRVAPPGLPERAATVERWEQLTGREAGDLHWFLMFAGLRFTVVMLRLSTLLVAMGYSPEPFGYDNPISHALDRLLADG